MIPLSDAVKPVRWGVAVKVGRKKKSSQNILFKKGFFWFIFETVSGSKPNKR